MRKHIYLLLFELLFAMACVRAGRAEDPATAVSAAILTHGGDAAAAVDEFTKLDGVARRPLLDFLGRL